MSIVEKAAEKLRSLQSEQRVPAAVELEPERDEAPDAEPASGGVPLVERLEARLRTEASQRPSEEAPAVPSVEPWHVDERALQHSGWLPREDGAGSRLADEVRRIKRPILDNIHGHGSKPLAHAERIVVTSAVPAEGKTFTSINLALSLALEPDFEVLLVDGDIQKSDITRTLGLDGRPGLMDLLTNERMNPGDVIVKTDIPNLSVLPSGERHPLAAELFGGRRMQQVLDDLGRHRRQRLLVFDSAPLLATPESQVLVAHMSQVLVVVAAGSTRQHELGAALEAADESQYVGLVLNMSRLPAIESHYYDHYKHAGYQQFQGQ